MKRFYKVLAGFLSAGTATLLALVLFAQWSIPDNLYIAQGEEIYISSRLSLVSLGKANLPVSMDLKVNDESGNNYKVCLKLFESVPIKEVQVQVIPRNAVVPGGTPFGIKMFTDGIIVVGMSDVQNGTECLSPAKDAGLKVGDILTSIDGNPLTRNEDVAHYISNCGGNEITVALQRDGQEMELSIQPVMSELDDCYKAGIWVRDSSAGIGTLTYYNPETLAFAGLGHAICDVDTGSIMPLSSGEVVDVNISGANAGHSGRPGELRGNFISDKVIGYLNSNSENGIYGFLIEPATFHDPVIMAMKQEIETGPATILATISGNQPQSFDIVIEKVNYSDSNSTKNMIIRVVDSTLLSTTGGIVQGMSGSPILQNDKLVGAVTHVFVNDPTRGYGIFAENMEKTLNHIEESKSAA